MTDLAHIQAFVKTVRNPLNGITVELSNLGSAHFQLEVGA
jgi:hypothetical protein